MEDEENGETSLLDKICLEDQNENENNYEHGNEHENENENEQEQINE